MDSLWTLRYLSQLSCSSIDTTTALVISSRGRLSVWSHIWPGAFMDVGPMSYWDVCFCGSTAYLGRPSLSDLGRPCTSVLVVPHPAWNVRGHLSLWYYVRKCLSLWSHILPGKSMDICPCGPMSNPGCPGTLLAVIPAWDIWGLLSLWSQILPGTSVPVVQHPSRDVSPCGPSSCLAKSRDVCPCDPMSCLDTWDFWDDLFLLSHKFVGGATWDARVNCPWNDLNISHYCFASRLECQWHLPQCSHMLISGMLAVVSSSLWL